MFGAYYGLALAWYLGVPHSERRKKEKASIVSDVFAFIGTLFLWLYWPSFVAGLAVPGTAETERALTNTILALVASTIVTFAASAFLCGVFRPCDIQNATLAGGVAIGATANLTLHPLGAMAIGSIAGLVSALGFAKLSPWLEKKIKLHDTCGIHNLHGMPSILGGLVSAVSSSFGIVAAHATPDCHLFSCRRSSRA